jgi:hypothetical protein
MRTFIYHVSLDHANEQFYILIPLYLLCEPQGHRIATVIQKYVELESGGMSELIWVADEMY